LLSRETGLPTGRERAGTQHLNQQLACWAEDDFLQHCSAQYADLGSVSRSTIATAFSPDGGVVASTHGDHTVKVVSCDNGSCLKVLDGHRRTPWVVRFHPSNPNLVVSGSLDNMVVLWRIAQAQKLISYDFGKPIHSVAFHPTGDLLVVASGHRVYVWNYLKPSKSPAVHVLKSKRSLRAVHFHPAGKNLLLTAEVMERRTSSASQAAQAAQQQPISAPASAPTTDQAHRLAEPRAARGQAAPHAAAAGAGVEGASHNLTAASVPRAQPPAGPHRPAAGPRSLLTSVIAQAEERRQQAAAAATQPPPGRAAPTQRAAPLETSVNIRGFDGPPAAASNPSQPPAQALTSVPSTHAAISSSGSAARTTAVPPPPAQADMRLAAPVATPSATPPRQDPMELWQLRGAGGSTTHAIPLVPQPLGPAYELTWAWDMDPSDMADCALQSVRERQAIMLEHQLLPQLWGGQEQPCLVNVHLWDFNPARPCAPLANARLSVQRVVLCSEMCAHFSPCGRYLALCVMPEQCSPQCAEWQARQEQMLHQQRYGNASPCSVSSASGRADTSLAHGTTPMLDQPVPTRRRTLAEGGAPEPPPPHAHPSASANPAAKTSSATAAAATAAAAGPPRPNHYELRVYSLDGPTFGQLLHARPIHAAHCLTSLQFSPTSEHVLVAYGRRHISLCSLVVDNGYMVPVHTVLEVYRVADMSLVRVLPSMEDEVNAASFHPTPGGGIVYGTKEGKLRILRHDRRTPRGASIQFLSSRLDQEMWNERDSTSDEEPDPTPPIAMRSRSDR